MRVYEKELTIPVSGCGESPLLHLSANVTTQLGHGLIPIRVAVTATTKSEQTCEVAVLTGHDGQERQTAGSVFDFAAREPENPDQFNVVLVVPTGIGAEIGGHAGDAAPVARLLAQTCDYLITHPNVVNASDINEMPDNGLYVEGSVLCRMLMGTVGLHRRRSNRVLIVIDDHPDELFVNATVNAINAAVSASGLRCAGVVKLNPPIKLRAMYSPSGRAAGFVNDLGPLFELLEARRGDYDAVGLSTVIDVPRRFHTEYFESAGSMVNPWGGVEAMLTHAVSQTFNVPSAHAPMFESRDIANADPGIVDARMAAEAVSLTFVQCVIKGLHRSPAIVPLNSGGSPRVMTASDVSCLVIPQGCLGIPTLAALEQGIPVIEVAENSNVMRNDLRNLPWADGQFYQVANYWESAGILAGMRAGICPYSVRRPLVPARVQRHLSKSGALARSQTNAREVAGT